MLSQASLIGGDTDIEQNTRSYFAVVHDSKLFGSCHGYVGKEKTV